MLPAGCALAGFFLRGHGILRLAAILAEAAVSVAAAFGGTSDLQPGRWVAVSLLIYLP